MKINWKLRLKNKAVLMALTTCIIGCGYQVLGIMGVTPPVSENEVSQFVLLVLNVLVTLGVVVDPTTKGVGDSYVAMKYEEPR